MVSPPRSPMFSPSVSLPLTLWPGAAVGGQRIELGHQFGGQRFEGSPVIFGPPVAEGAAAVELRTLVIEAVADLVPDDGADAAIVDGVVRVRREERGLEDGRRKDDLIEHRVVVRVDGLGRHQPLVLVNGLADLVEVTVDVGVVGPLDVPQQIRGVDFDCGVVDPFIRGSRSLAGMRRASSALPFWCPRPSRRAR